MTTHPFDPFAALDSEMMIEALGTRRQPVKPRPSLDDQLVAAKLLVENLAVAQNVKRVLTHRFQTTREIAKALGITAPKAEAALKILYDAGEAVRAYSQHPRWDVVWRMADDTEHMTRTEWLGQLAVGSLVRVSDASGGDHGTVRIRAIVAGQFILGWPGTGTRRVTPLRRASKRDGELDGATPRAWIYPA